MRMSTKAGTKIPQTGGVVPSQMILVKLVQPSNAYSPMVVTLSGMIISVKPVQPQNAPQPMVVTLLGMIISVKPALTNIKGLMVVTLLGITKLSLIPASGTAIIIVIALL
jgi:hypothetical protein